MKGQLAAAPLFTAVAMLLYARPTAVDQLPDPDGKPADMTRKVNVFFIMGQCNMLEMSNAKIDLNVGKAFVALLKGNGK